MSCGNSKIKVLYDVEQLMKECVSARSGIFRVADELFKYFSNADDVDLYLAVTENKGDLSLYLKSIGREDLQNKVVILPSAKVMTKNKNILQVLRSKVWAFFLKSAYRKKLSGFDWYFSPFSPVAPLIYRQELKTAVMVHDIIPIVRPDLADKGSKFLKKYKNWMSSLQADLIVFNSVCSQKDFLNFRKDVLPYKTLVAYLGADERFVPSVGSKNPEMVLKKYSIESKSYILSLADKNKRKNFPHLIDSFVRFIEKTGNQDVCLVLAGPKRKGGIELDDVISSYEKYRNRIINIGFVEENDLAALYANAAFFVYPSLYEGFGLPVLEAMKCGVPVICGNNSSLPEVAGDAALYISGSDEDETAEVMSRLFKDKSLQNSLAQKGLERSSGFSWKRTGETVLNALLANSGRE